VSTDEELVAGARALAAHRLVDAFGHLSARSCADVLITPSIPLGAVADTAALVRLPADADELPDGVPREAWIHRCIYARRADVGAICRAQPPSVLACAAAGLPVRALHGQGAFLGAEVAVHDDATLVRDQARGDAVATALGTGHGVVLRGNGAVTVGTSPGLAVARMFVLETSARINLTAASSGTPVPLDAAELSAWEAVADEILARLWAYLRRSVG
jgi:ribulose-5-phosphate 4-epimerase/fuculose-1-phosphate aldolase